MPHRHRSTPPHTAPLLLWLLLNACTPPVDDRIDGVGDLLDAGAVDAGNPAGAPLAYAVVASDYTVTSVGLLGPDASPLALDFLHSGSAPAGLVTALSGDVVLPTRSGEPRVLVLLDRFRTDVLTRIDPGSGEVLGQLRTQAPQADDARGVFASNPYDYVRVGPGIAWVSRFGVNAHVPADDPDRGADLLQVDPDGFTRGGRIAFSALDGVGTRRNPDTGAEQEVPLFARPSAVVRIGELLVVGIARLSQTFDASGEGLVALVDPATGEVTGLPLPGFENCGSVSPIPGAPQRVVVACSGFYRGVLRDTAGLAVVALEGGALRVAHSWRASEHPRDALAVSSVVALGDSLVAAATGGLAAADGKPEVADAMYLVDIATGEQRLLLRASQRYVFGGGAFDPGRGLLLVPDASTDADGLPAAGVRVFERADDGTFGLRETLDVHPDLPARQLRAL